MEQVVKQIIGIEKKAQDLLDGAYKEKELKEKKLKEQLEQLEERIIQDANNKVDQLREREIATAKEEADNLKKNCNEKIEAIDNYYNELADMWCERLTNRVLKR